MRCMDSYFAFACVSVRVQDNSKNIESINFIFGGGFLFDPGRKPFDFEKQFTQG